MWLEGRGATRFRRRPRSECWREAKLRPKDEQRIDEFRRLFEEKGWRLFVGQEQRDSWAAWFFHEEVGPVLNDVVRRPTAVKAAQAAWEKFSNRPHFIGNPQHLRYRATRVLVMRLPLVVFLFALALARN
jgi:hypothetical protein